MIENNSSKQLDLVDELEEYRLKNKISQKKLAEQINVSLVTVNHWLTRKTKISKMNEYQIRSFLKEKIENDK